MPDLAQCNLEFLNALKGVLGANDGKSVLKTLTDRAKELQNDGLSENESINQAAKELSDRTEELGQLRTRQQLINIQKYDIARKFVFSFKDSARGLKALMGGVEGSLVKGSKNSVNSFQRSVVSKLLSTFEKELESQGLWDAYRDKNTHLHIFEEIFNPGSTGNAAAAKIAKALKEMWGMGRAMLNERGAAVGDLNEYVGRQIHNQERMLKLSDNWVEHRKALRAIKKLSVNSEDRIKRLKNAAYQNWRNFILPRLDQERTFKGADTEKFLRKVFDDIVDGNYDTIKGGDFEGDFKFTGPGNYAKKISQRRLLHFKDGRGSFEYNEKYGAGSIFGMISRTVEGLGKNIGLMEKLGTNPRAMFERIAKEVKAAGGSRLSLWQSENLYKEVSGEVHSVVDNMFAKAFIGARLVQTMAKLGGVTLSALPDIGLMADQLRANGMGWLESETKALFGTLKFSKEKKAVSDMLGVYFESITQQLMHQYSSIDSEFGALSKAAQQSYKIFGITQFDEIKRRTIGTLLSRNLTLLKDTKFVSLNKQLKQTLLEHGIEEKEWNLMRKTENINKPYENKQFITPQDPSAYTLDSIKEYLGKDDPTSREIKKVRDDMEFNLRSYYLNNTANVNMLPGAVERAWMHMGTDPNTPLGQSVRAIMQFKGFALSMSRRKLGRFYGHMLENGFNWKDVTSDTAHFVQMAISLYGYGYLAISAKDLVAGKTLRSLRDPRTSISAMLQGGFAGLYGDFLLGNYKRSGGESFLESAAGPTFDTVNQAFEVFSRLKSMDHPGTAAFYLIKNNTPFMNLWYAKAAFNYLFLYGIQDKINPGSLERMKSNLRRNYNQKFIFDPSQYAHRFR